MFLVAKRLKLSVGVTGHADSSKSRVKDRDTVGLPDIWPAGFLLLDGSPFNKYPPLSDWSNGIGYHIFDTKTDTEFKSS